MALRTLSIGGATYDLFVTLAKLEMDATGKYVVLPLGGKVNVEQVTETCGGGACNTSVGLSRLGCNAQFCGLVGEDQWGEKLAQSMRKEGVDLRGLTVVEGEVTSFSLILSAPGEDRVILYTAGTNRHLHDATFDRDLLTQVDWVYLNRIQEGSSSICDDVVAAVVERPQQGLTWNPGGSQIRDGIKDGCIRNLLRMTTLLLLNKEEAETFTGEKEISQALRALTAAGAKYVCITDGKNGTWASEGKSIWHCPALPRTPVDTTGAGDAFGIGVTWALGNGLNLPTALQAGTMNASSVLAHIGAQAGLLTDTSMRAQLKTTPLDVTVSPLV